MNQHVEDRKQKRPISTSAVVRIVVWSIVLLILSGVFALSLLATALRDGGFQFGLISLGGYTYEDASSYHVGGGDVSETIRDIDIDWLSGDIEILPAPEGATSVTVSEDYSGDDDDERLRWRIREGKLQIKFQKSRWGVGIKHSAPTKKLTVFVPTSLLSALGEVDIDTVESKVTFEGHADEFSFDAVDGDLTVTGSVGELDIDSTETVLNFTGTLGHGDFDGVDLTATLWLDGARGFDIDGVGNAVTLYLADAVTGFRVERDALGGKTTVSSAFEGSGARDDYDQYWGDGSLEIRIDGIDVQLNVEKLTKD